MDIWIFREDFKPKKKCMLVTRLVYSIVKASLLLKMFEAVLCSSVNHPTHRPPHCPPPHWSSAPWRRLSPAEPSEGARLFPWRAAPQQPRTPRCRLS